MTGARRDRGAVALMAALLAVVLFAVGALAVDLGNAWARKRQVQKQVDVTATGAGALLPATDTNEDAIAGAVAGYLNANAAQQSLTVDADDLLDATTANGQIVFLDDDGDTCQPSSMAPCPAMRVIAPPAEVDFGLAGAIGFSGTEVQSEATVQVMSSIPEPEDLVPYWLPQGCGYGPAQVDTSQGGSSKTTSTATSTPTSTPTATATASPTATATSTGTASSSPTAATSTTAAAGPTAAIGTHLIGGVIGNMTVGTSSTVKGLTITGFSGNVDRASIRFYSPDYSWYVEYAATDSKKLTDPLNVPDFVVGTEVTGTPGTWHVYALIAPQNDKKAVLSSNSLTAKVMGPTETTSAPAVTAPTGTATPSPTPTETATATASDVPVACVGQDRGNFGQLDSPRGDVAKNTSTLALNLAVGLDHTLVPFPNAPGKDCGTEKAPVTGASLDVTPVEDGRNCIIADPGNDGSKPYAGLIGGVDGHPGRLDVANGPTTCPGQEDLSIGGKLINNDTLTCFLRDGATRADIAATSGVTPSMLDQSIVDSPRFVWLPVVYANDRAQKGYQPILDFLPGFITDETQTSSTTGETNGLQINGNSIKTISVFVFSKDALDLDLKSATVDYDPNVGRPIVRLVK